MRGNPVLVYVYGEMNRYTTLTPLRIVIAVSPLITTALSAHAGTGLQEGQVREYAEGPLWAPR